MTDDLRDVKADLARVADVDGDILCRAALQEIEELEAKVQSLTALLDNQLGTPCEQVRHQEQVEALESKLAKAVEVLEEIATDEHPLGWVAIAALAELKVEK